MFDELPTEELSSGEIIKRLRKEKMLTQKKLAEKCGMHESAIGRIETSKGTPRTETLDKIAKALGVKSTELLPSWSVIQTRNEKVFDRANGDLVHKILESEEKKWVDDEKDPHMLYMWPNNQVDQRLCERVVELMKDMNLSGKLRVVHYAEDLTRIPDYLNKEGE